MPKETLVFLDAGSVGNDIAWPDFSAFGEVASYQQTTAEELPDRIRGASFIFTNKVLIRAEHINAAPNLRYIGTISTGYNQVDLDAAARKGVPVCNVPGYSTPSVAQHVFALTLALASDVCSLSQSVRNGDWLKSPQFCYWLKPIIELSGKVLGIVGFGDIGRQVARIGNAMGMEVIAYAPRPKAAPDFGPFAFTDLGALFRKADVVTLHCPLTPETDGMINLPLLRTMKKGAFLINTARGQLVNEVDLGQALHEGLIAGAGLDVVSVEPMPDDNPLRCAPNCILTPHVAWAGAESRSRLLQGVYDNVASFVAGVPRNVQNMHKG